MPPTTPEPPTEADLAPLLADLGLPAGALGAAGTPEASRCLPASVGSVALRERADRELGARGVLFVWLAGTPDEAELARWRNELWPLLHAVAVYEIGSGGTTRRSQSGAQKLPAPVGAPSRVLALQRRAWVMSPDATTAKFDQNASGWNGEPGGPGYPHFRWMRRLVGRFLPARAGERVLDFGCGAGWVGVEAVAGVPGAELCFFDPSPEMVRIAEGNARAAGIAKFEGRVGFGEKPPFPAPGEERFDLVISSGVVSFSPDFEAWIEGLVSTCKPGGRLVVGDLNPTSRGMRQRRREKALVPVRELNASTSMAVREALEARGFTHRETAGYQLSRPVPQLMYVNETRLGGVLSRPLVWLNQAATRVDRWAGDALQDRFDSWVMAFDGPR